MTDFVKNKISAVMVSYHTGDVMWHVVDSVLSQDKLEEIIIVNNGKLEEIIIVNNGNPKKYNKRLEDLAKCHPKLKLLQGHGNIGLAAGYNLGAEQAVGEYLLFLNPHTLLQKDTLTRMLDTMSTTSEAWAVGCVVLDSKDTNIENPIGRRNYLSVRNFVSEHLGLSRLFSKSKCFTRISLSEQKVLEGPVYVPVISSLFMMFKQDKFWEADGFDEMFYLYGEDFDLCLHINDMGGKVAFTPDVKAINYQHTEDLFSFRMEFYRFTGTVRYFYKNFNGAYMTGCLFGAQIIACGKANITMALKKF